MAELPFGLGAPNTADKNREPNNATKETTNKTAENITEQTTEKNKGALPAFNRKTRIAAIEWLYQKDADNGNELLFSDEALPIHVLVRMAAALPSIDANIAERTHHLAPTDRAILRLALFEMEAGGNAAHIMNEAIELAKAYGSNGAFINALLDDVHKAQTLEAAKKKTTKTAALNNPTSPTREPRSAPTPNSTPNKATPKPPNAPPWPRSITIIGTGLMGTSIARQCKQWPTPPTIYGYDGEHRTRNAKYAKRIGAVDDILTALPTTPITDLTLFACPIGALDGLFARMAPPDGEHLYMDIASTKRQPLALAANHWGDSEKTIAPPYFIAAHPIAGVEFSGAANSLPNLIEDAKVIITPHAANTNDAIKNATQFWRALGATVHDMDATTHDKTFAEVSHLPHLLAFAMVEGLVAAHGEAILQWSGGGFRDFTRIAASDPKLWAEIVKGNEAAVRAALMRHIATLNAYLADMNAGDYAALEAKFTTAQTAKQNMSMPAKLP